MAIDLATAVNRFILQYAVPSIAQESVYRGYQNRTETLAAGDGEDYCVYALSDTKRIGTNITTLDPANERMGAKAMREYVYEIDFSSTNEAAARSRAEIMETLAGSAIGVDYFRQHGFGLLFADDIKPLPYVLGTKQYVHRYRVALHITVWTVAGASQDYFDKAEVGQLGKIPYLENVDVHHPVKKGVT